MEQALENGFGFKLDDLNLHKTETGKWICDKYYFSLSHSKNAIAVSNVPVGVDIELIAPLKRNGIQRKILSQEELPEFDSLLENDQTDYLYKWTVKESEFERSDDKFFIPTETVITNDTQANKH